VVDHYCRQEFRQHIDLNEEICGSGDNPDQAVEMRLLAEQARTAITMLTADQQQVITLKFLEGLSNQEVAQAIGKSVGAVKSLQHRALASLQQQLSQAKEEVPV
jgi:RNA polymerase sigma-70 factor (ECF subfamily)